MTLNYSHGSKMADLNKSSLDTAAPTVAAVESQVSVTENQERRTGEFGMTESEVKKETTEEVIQDTVLTAAEENTLTSALTEYVDVQKSMGMKIPFKGTPIADPAFVFPRGYFSVAERSTRITTIKPNLTGPTYVPFVRVDCLNALMSKRFIGEKFSYPMYVRFNMEIQVRLLATNFHYGQLLVVYRPAYCPFVRAHWGNESDEIIAVMPGTTNNNTCSPYDFVYTASQLPHKVIPITSGASVTVDCPWTLNRQYVSTREMLYAPNHHGYLDIYILTPILPADIDQCAIQIFTRMKDVVGFGYRAVPNPCDTAKSPKLINYKGFKKNYVTASGIDEIRWNATPALPALIDFSQGSWQFIQDFALRYQPSLTWNGKPPSKSNPFFPPVREIEQIQGYEVPEVTGGSLTDSWNTIVATANTIASFIGAALAFFGLSKPPIADIPTRYIKTLPPLSSSVCPDTTVSTGFNPVSLVDNLKEDHADTVVFEKAARIFTFMNCWKLEKINSQLIFISPRSCFASKDGLVCAMSPAAYISNRFKYWRGDLLYRLHFSSSSFVATRVRIYVKYMTDDSEDVFGLIPTQVVEVKGDTVVEGRVPFLCDRYWAPTVGRRNLYAIQVEMLDSTVSWKNDQAPPVYYSVWYAFDGFQVSVPVEVVGLGVWHGECGGLARTPDLSPWPNFVNGVYCTGTTLSSENVPGFENEIEQIQGFDLPGETNVSSVTNVGMNDIPTSFYHLAKRYTHAKALSLMPFEPMPYICKAAAYPADTTCVLTYYPMAQYGAPLFRWQRGSVNVICKDIDGLMDYYDPTQQDFLYVRNANPSDAAYHFAVMSRPYQGAVTSDSLLVSRSPYRASTNFLSTPTMVPWWKTLPSVAIRGEYDWNNFWMSLSDWLKETKFRIYFKTKDPKTPVEFDWSFGDDLCYSQWMGVPVHGGFIPNDMRAALWKAQEDIPKTTATRLFSNPEPCFSNVTILN
nr:capsid protein [Picornavirales sp.]